MRNVRIYTAIDPSWYLISSGCAAFWSIILLLFRVPKLAVLIIAIACAIITIELARRLPGSHPGEE